MSSALDSFARIPRALAILSRHPEGLPLTEVAAELEVSDTQLRSDILQYYSADIPPTALMGLSRSDTIEFLASDGDEELDPDRAPVLRAVTDRPMGELGIEYLRVDELATLFDAARSLSETEPDNGALAEAVRILGESFLAEASVGDQPGESSIVATVRKAMEHQRQVELRYSRAWRPGVSQRVVDPYALRHTRRGWELDAGTVTDGSTRTYLVERIDSATVLPSSFERPADLADLLERERRQTTVELSVPQGTQWVVDRFAESSAIGSSDSDDVTLTGSFLPPVAERVGLVLVIAGSGAFVVDPPELVDAGADLAQRLLEHHGL
jgi:predicted DNA-binding transcriptional regulator YafY